VEHDKPLLLNLFPKPVCLPKSKFCLDHFETVIQGSRTESAPLGDLKHLAEQGELLFDQKLLSFAMGNSVAVVDNNSNYKLSKERQIDKIDNVAALLDAYVAYQRHREDFE